MAKKTNRRITKGLLMVLLFAVMAVVMCSCGNSGVKIDERHFPDKNFREYVLKNFDLTGDGYLDEDEISRATIVAVGDYDIFYLDGIEYLTNLERLSCSDNHITKLVLNKCTKLKSVWCANNEISTLDVSKCVLLEELHCYENQITELNVSKLTELKKLDFRWNQISKIDISKCTLLESVSGSWNPISKLEVSNCPLLQWIYCSDTGVTELDVSECTACRLHIYCNDDVRIIGADRENVYIHND